MGAVGTAWLYSRHLGVSAIGAVVKGRFSHDAILAGPWCCDLVTVDRALFESCHHWTGSMLDIYYADPSITVMPEDPGELEFAGSIDIDAHRSVALLIDRGGPTDIRFKYFEDSLLTPVQVASLLGIVVADGGEREGHGQASATSEAIRGILETAVSKGLGLVAFGD